MDSASARPRLIFICKLNPWRLNNGAIIRNYWLLHALSQRFDVDLVTADTADDRIPLDFKGRLSGIYCFPRPLGAGAKVTRAAGALRRGSTFFTSGSVTKQMQAAVAQLVATRSYAAVFTELGVVDAIPAGDVPIVYSAHNCEAALMMRRAELEPMWSRFGMTVDAFRIRGKEARLIERSFLVTACSQNDIDDTLSYAPSIAGRAVVIPNGVDCATYADVARDEGEPGVVLVTGSFDWLPNRRGLMWFMHEVLPVLEKLLAGTSFDVRIAGRMNAALAKSLTDMSPNVTVVPNVPRMDVELRRASVVAAPVIASSGTRLRILEAWAAGRAIVTTPHGAFGLDYTEGVDLISERAPQQFAEAVVVLLRNRELRARLRAAGLTRATAYDWSAIGTKLIAALEDAGVLAPALDTVSAIRAEL